VKFQFIGVLVCIFFVPLSAIAEEDLPSDLHSSQPLSDDSSDEVMVILGKVPRPIDDVFGAASVISRETIDRELVHDIADLVRYEAGISIERTGTRFGLSGFKIRGIGGNRVAIEIDGIPVSDQFNIGSFSNSGRNFIDIDLVQQVEILRGPASSVYGSNAIGGVVSFISKKPVDLLAQTKSDYYVGLKGGYYGVDNSQLFSLNGAMETGHLSGLITLSTSSGNEFDNNTGSDTPSDQQDYSSKSILTKVYYAISDDQQFSLSFDYFERESETDVNAVLGLGRFRSTTSIFGDDQSERYSIAFSYEFNPDLALLEGGVVRLYHQKSETEQLTDETRFSRGTSFGFDRDFFYQQEIDGLRLNLYTNWGGSNLEHRIGYGLEWSERKITELRDGLQTNLDANTSTNIILSEVFPLRDFPISTVKELGIYLNDEIEVVGTNFRIIPALRFDQYRLDPEADVIYLEDNPSTNIVDIKESEISPKIGIRYQLANNSSLFIQYFEGFRAAPFEDANIGLDIPLFNIRAIPNPELKSESSQGYEIGYRYSGKQHTLDWIAFHTEYDDFIQTKVNLGFDPVTGRVIFQSQNIDRARIYGSEFQYSYRTNDWVTQDDDIKAYFNLFWSKGKNEETGQPLNNIDPNHALLGFNWNSPDEIWSLALHASLYSSKNKIDELDDPTEQLFKTPGYGILDFIINYQISESTSLSTAIYNIGDKKYWRWSDVEGLTVGDPIIETLAASGINASLQLKIVL